MKNIKRHINVKINLILCFLLIVHSANADRTKQALKYLEKGDLGKVEEIILKSLEKESFNPASKYLYAVLYSTEEFNKYNIDSARVYILTAIEEFASLDEKQVETLRNSGIALDDLEGRKLIVESLLFQIAVKENSIEQFNFFLRQNENALQADQAIKKRDSLAFLVANKEHTWRGYKTYMENYSASRDFDRAKSYYHQLIYQSKTESGKLRDLQKFVREHPNSPYKSDIQKEIFSILVADGDPETILSFIEEYQNPILNKRAIDILYHLSPVGGKEVFKLRHHTYKTIIDSIDVESKYDDEVLFPILEDEQYAFINFSGNQVISNKFDVIPAKYYCGNIRDNVIDVTINNNRQLINRNGTKVFDAEFDDVEDIGIGVLKLVKQGKYKALHKSGVDISGWEFDDISIVGGRLLKVRSNGKVGLMGITGRKICTLEYDDIYTIKNYWIFEKNDKIGIMALEDIIKGANGGKLDPIMKYEEAELIDDQYLICFTENKEVLFDPNLRRVVPEGEQRINTRFKTWTTKQPFGYRVFNKEVGELTHILYDELLQNREWLALKKSNRWSVYRKGLEDTPIIGLDSVKLIGDDIVMVFRELSGTAIFPNKKTVEFTTGDALHSIGGGENADNHYLVINKTGENTLYKNGELLFTADYDEIGYISDSAFYVKVGEKYGAVGVDGRLIMRVRYDAIIKAENGIAPVLYNGKFGAYNFIDRILLKLDYDRKLKSYNKELLIVRLEGKEGFLNKYNEDIIEPEYDMITYWTDSIALVNNSGEWSFVDIYSNREVYGSILDYKVLSQQDNRTTLRIRTADGYGIYDSQSGLTIEPTFSDIININTIEKPLYFCEKSVPEGDYYIAIYKNKSGKTIRSQAYRAEEYERIVCE